MLPSEQPSERAWHRFRPGWSWIGHVWKSTVNQDHGDLAAILRGLLPEDGVVIDIGAHGGQVTRLLSDLVPRGHVFAVEPSSYARSILRANLLFRPRRNLSVVPMALGAAPGLALLSTSVKRTGAMGYGIASLVPDPGRAALVREPVPVGTLDALVETLELPRVDLLKIDVEGCEAAVLAGAAGSLARFRPAVYLEVARDRLLRAGSSPEEIRAMLSGLGYAAQAVPGPLLEGADGDWLFRARPLG